MKTGQESVCTAQSTDARFLPSTPDRESSSYMSAAVGMPQTSDMKNEKSITKAPFFSASLAKKPCANRKREHTKNGKSTGNTDPINRLSPSEAPCEAAALKGISNAVKNRAITKRTYPM